MAVSMKASRRKKLLLAAASLAAALGAALWYHEKVGSVPVQISDFQNFGSQPKPEMCKNARTHMHEALKVSPGEVAELNSAIRDPVN